MLLMATSICPAFEISNRQSPDASLWVASDIYTPILMDHFYRHLAMGEEKADALRKANLGSCVDYSPSSDCGLGSGRRLR